MKSFLLIMMLAVPAFAGPPSDAVKAANTALQNDLASNASAAKVKADVLGFIDVAELGKAAMGANWTKLTPAEQKEFVQTLETLIAANYAHATASNVNYTVAYTGETPGANNTVTVSTVVTSQTKGRPVRIAIDYVVESSGSGYRAVDVITDGVGLVANYGQQFNTIIQHSGVSGLLEKMKKKQQSTP